MTALKEGAAHAGFDPKRYSSKSLRGGFATAAAAAGVPADELNLRGGWAQGSKVPGTYYTSHWGKNRGGMAIIADEVFFDKPMNCEFGESSLEQSGR